jgi:hypothetical protein
MSTDPQTIVALLIVAVAAAWMVRRVFRWGRGSESGCGGCGSCPSNSAKESGSLVTLGDFRQSADSHR